MARKKRFRDETKSHESRSIPKQASTIPPLGYCPNLRRALRSHGATMLMTYFEVHWPNPQDDMNGRVLVDHSRTLVDLQLGERALRLYLSIIATRYPSEAKLRAAQRSAREFSTLQRHESGALKAYSVLFTGDRNFSIRRNWPYMRNLVERTGASFQQISHRVNESNLGFGALREDFALETGREFALAVSRELLEPGRKHAFAERRVWSEERRARYEATIAARKLKNPYIDQR